MAVDLKLYCKHYFYHVEGVLYNKQDRTLRSKKGDLATSMKVTPSCPYLCVNIEGSLYRVHQVVFILHYGYLPLTIDHKDRNKLNNHPENLREASVTGNNDNRGLGKSTTGVKGVLPHGERFRARISVNNKTQHIGLYDTKEEASKARIKYAATLGRVVS
jgi:hypothetical protein